MQRRSISSSPPLLQSSSSENNEEEKKVEKPISDEKRAIIENNIDLTGVDGAAFWKLYDEYEKSRQEIGKEKLELLQKLLG